MFAGSDAGGRRAAAIYSLIETAKLNGLNPQHYIADVLAYDEAKHRRDMRRATVQDPGAAEPDFGISEEAIRVA